MEFTNVGLLHAKPLTILNTYDKAIEWPIYFNSTIPKKLGLPELKDNKAEGIVIRSMTGRFITKIKIKEFNESNDGNNIYDNNGYVASDNQVIVLDRLKIDATKHITLARLNNAISKIGEYDKNKSEILDEFVNDVQLEINCFHDWELTLWIKNQCEKIM